MKEIGLDMTNRLRNEVNRARQVSALASQKSKGLYPDSTPGSLAYLARNAPFGSSFDKSFGTKPTNSTLKQKNSGHFNPD